MTGIGPLATSLLLAASLAGQTQPLPDGAALMKQSQAAMKAFHSLQFSSDMTMEMGNGMKMSVTGGTAMVNPGKTRTETKVMGMTMLMVSDGETSWIYNSSNKQYVKKHAALGPAAIFSALGMSNVPDFSKVQTEQKTIGADSLDVDGQKHECWIVESHMGEMEVPAAPGAKMTGAVSKTWLDRKLLIALKADFALKMQMPQMPDPVEMHMVMTLKDLKIDQPVAESLFQFTPPADAREVDNMMGAAMVKADLAGKPAPAFSVKSLDGATYSLESLKGKAVLLDFWATWCSPCRQSMPVLEKLHRTYKDQGLVVLAVDTGEDRDTVAEFLKKSPVPYASALSGDSGIMEAYRVSAFPTFVMIGRDGKVVALEVGYAGEDVLAAMPVKAGLEAAK